MFHQFDSDDIETYFNRLNAQLKKMPPEDRHELHQELRQHLDALTAAHEELGAVPEEAVQAALRQLGDPTKIGQRMQREWESKAVKDAKMNWRAVIGVAALQATAIYWYFWHNLTTDMSAWQYGAFLLAPPVIAGSLTGWISPKTWWRDITCGYLPAALLLLVAVIRDFILFNRAFLSPRGLGLLQHEVVTFTLIWEMWLVIGWACAAVTKTLRRPIDKRRACTL